MLVVVLGSLARPNQLPGLLGLQRAQHEQARPVLRDAVVLGVEDSPLDAVPE
jgi:hypothetical protein